MSNIGLPAAISRTNGMVFKITGGIWFFITGLALLGVIGAAPAIVMGLLALVAGVALIAGA
jgi:hypothetical protein